MGICRRWTASLEQFTVFYSQLSVNSFETAFKTFLFDIVSCSFSVSCTALLNRNCRFLLLL